MRKKYGEVVNRNGQWYVAINDGGWLYMSELTTDGFKTCAFATKEDAEKALNDYLEAWN